MRKDSFIDSKLSDTTSKIRLAQKELLSLIIDEIAGELDINDKKQILNTPKNIRLLNKINSVYDDFNKIYGNKVMTSFAGGFSEISNFNKQYFIEMGFDNKTLDSALSQVESVKKSIGITKKNGKSVIEKGGYLDSVVSGSTDAIANKIKSFTLNSINTRTDWGEYKSGLKEMISGTKTIPGALEQYWNQYAFDSYNIADRAENVIIGEKLKLKAFLYAGGGKIKTSRPFCKGGYDKVCGCKFEPKINKVFLVDEFKKEFGSIDFQGKIKGDIMHTLGGYNCRHYPRFISNEEAIRRRPELKGKL